MVFGHGAHHGCGGLCRWESSPHLPALLATCPAPTLTPCCPVVRAGFFGLGAATMLGGGEWAVDTAQAISEAVSPTATKFAVAFTLSYQWFGSARHAYWDLTAKGFTNKAMLNSAYAMWATTIGLSLGLAFYSLPPFPGSKKAK